MQVLADLGGSTDETSTAGTACIAEPPIRGVLGDYRIGGLLRLPDFPFIALRGGYRVIQIQGETLHGGEIGAVFTW